MAIRIEADPGRPAFHPGEYLAEEIEARGWSQRELARRMHRPYQVVNEIIRGKRAVTADTALALEAALEMDARLWLNLQTSFDLQMARRKLAATAPAGA